MSYTVQHNLPIFGKSQVIPHDGKYYMNATIGYESYLGCMKTSPRKDYFAFITIGDVVSKIGRLDLMDVNRKVKNDSILIELIPNKYGNIVDFTEFVPKMKSGYLSFRTEEIKMSFFGWMSFLNKK